MIRPASVEDLDAMVAIERVSSGSPWSRSAFADELERAVSQVFVLCAPEPLSEPGDGGAAQVCGFVAFWVVGDEAEVLNIAVAPESRRRGYGLALLNEMLRASRAKGARRAFLDVRSGNTPALGLYRRRGFAPVGRRSAYYQDTGEDAVVMALSFDDPAG